MLLNATKCYFTLFSVYDRLADTKDTVVGSLITEEGTITFDTSDPSQSATIAEIKAAVAQYQ